MTEKINNRVFSLKTLVSIVVKHWYYFVVSLLICLSFSMWKYYSSPVIYPTSATVLVRQESKQSPFDDIHKEAKENIKATMENQIQILGSHANFLKLVDTLQLETSTYIRHNYHWKEIYEVEPVKLIIPDDLLKRYRGKFVSQVKHQSQGEWDLQVKYYKGGYFADETFNCTLDNLNQAIQTPWGVFHLVANSKKYKTEDYHLQYISLSKFIRAEQIKGQVSISLLKRDTKLLSIKMNSEASNKARDIINTLIQIYFEDNIQDQQKMSYEIASFLDSRLKSVSSELSNIEQEVENFKMRNQLANLEEQSSIKVNRITTIENRITQIKSQKTMYLFLSDYIKKMSTYDLIPENSDISSITRSLIRSYNDEVRQYNQLISTSNDQNPVVLNTKKDISLYRSNIQSNINTEMHSIDLSLKELQIKYDQYLKEVKNVPVVQKEYSRMSRELLLKREMYVYLLKKRENADLVLASGNISSRLVDSAYTSVSSVYPIRKLSLLMAFIFGLGLPLFFLYIKFIFQHLIFTKEQYENECILPVYDTVVTSQINLDSLDNKPDKQLVEHIRTIRNTIVENLENDSKQLIMLSSVLHDSSSTFVATHLASALANLNSKVLFVDINSYYSSLYSSKDSSRKGLLDILANNLEEDSKYIYSKENYSVLPIGTISDRSADLIVSKNFDKLVSKWKNDYDYIVCDLPSLLGNSVTNYISNKADQVVVVNVLGKIKNQSIEILNTYASNNKHSIIGSVLIDCKR